MRYLAQQNVSLRNVEIVRGLAYLMSCLNQLFGRGISHLANYKCLIQIGVESFVKDRNIHIDNVAFFQGSPIWDAMTDDLNRNSFRMGSLHLMS